jgi:hypothetical protein
MRDKELEWRPIDLVPLCRTKAVGETDVTPLVSQPIYLLKKVEVEEK